MLEEAASTISNMDKGFLYNIKNLIVNPQKLIKSYLHGKRSEIFNPLSFFLISITLYLIAESAYKELLPENTTVGSNESDSYSLGYKAGRFIKKYFNYFWGLSVVWLSLSTKLLFRRFNFAEHLTINSFIIGQATLAGILTYLLYQYPVMFDPIVYLIISVEIFIFYRKTDDTSVIVTKSIFSTLIFFLIIVATTIGLGKILTFYEVSV